MEINNPQPTLENQPIENQPPVSQPPASEPLAAQPVEEPKPKKSFAKSILGLLAFVAVLLLGYFVYQNMQLKKEIANIQSLPTPTATPTIAKKIDESVLKAGCDQAVSLTKAALAKGIFANYKKSVIEPDRTVDSLAIFYNLKQGSDFVGIKGDLVDSLEAMPKESISKKQMADFVKDSVSASLQNGGYKLNHLYESGVEFQTEAVTAVYEKQDEVFELAISVNSSDNEIPTYSIDLVCAPYSAAQKTTYLDLLNFPLFAQNETGREAMDLWEQNDQVYAINVTSLDGTGYSTYLMKSGDKFTSIYEGQEIPTCETFSSRKVGVGIRCLDENGQESVLNAK